MKSDPNATSPPVLKVVGRLTPQTPLQRLERISSFIYKHAHETVSTGELFPVRKAVGRPRPKR